MDEKDGCVGAAPLWLHAHQSLPPLPPSSCLQVLVVGSWDDWQYSLLLKKDAATGAFTCQANLNVGPGGRVPGAFICRLSKYARVQSQVRNLDIGPDYDSDFFRPPLQMCTRFP